MAGIKAYQNTFGRMLAPGFLHSNRQVLAGQRTGHVQIIERGKEVYKQRLQSSTFVYSI